VGRKHSSGPDAPTIGAVIPRNLVAFEDAMVLGTLVATVTESGIELTGRKRPSRETDFMLSVIPTLRQLARELGDREVTGFEADVLDRGLAHASLGSPHVRVFTATDPSEPTLGARELLEAVARRISGRPPRSAVTGTP